jgi:hypothetical protein
MRITSLDRRSIRGSGLSRGSNSKAGRATPRSPASFAAWYEVPDTAGALRRRPRRHGAVRNWWGSASGVPRREPAGAARTCRERAIGSGAPDRRTIGTGLRIGCANGLCQRRSSEKQNAKSCERRDAGNAEFHLSLVMCGDHLVGAGALHVSSAIRCLTASCQPDRSVRACLWLGLELQDTAALPRRRGSATMLTTRGVRYADAPRISVISNRSGRDIPRSPTETECCPT